MKKWVKRILLAGLALVVVLVGLGIGMNVLRHRRPDWYPKDMPTREAIAAASKSVTQKVQGIQGWAAGSQAKEGRQRNGNVVQSGDPDGDPEPSKTISFTEAELNAFFSQWGEQYHWGDKYSQFVTDPVLVIQDDRLIIAGTAKDLDTLVSVHLAPRLDEQGKLRLDVIRVMGGSLPLPRALWGGYIQRLGRAMEKRVAQERPKADIKPDGSANIHAVSAAMTELLQHALNGEPAEPVLFFPKDQQHAAKEGLPVRLTSVQAKDKTLTLTVVPLTSAEREALLKHIREPAPKPVGDSAKAGDGGGARPAADAARRLAAPAAPAQVTQAQ